MNFLKLWKIFCGLEPQIFQSHVAASVVGSVAGGLLQSSSASDAANAQQQAAQSANATQLQIANQANATQQQFFNTTQKNLAPFLNQGTTSVNQLQTDLQNGTLGGQFTNADLNANLAPNYAFQLQQGQQALQNSQAAQDGVLSGAALKQMQQYTQNTAAGAYQNAYNNWLTSQNLNYGQLSGLASLGENAGAMVGNAGSSAANAISNTLNTTGTNVSNNTIGAGNAAAAGMIGSANALSGAANSIGGYAYLNNLTGGNSNNSGGISNFGSDNPDFGSALLSTGF